MIVPSGENAQVNTYPVPGGVDTDVSVASTVPQFCVSHTFKVVSSHDPDTSTVPSGENAQVVTELL